MPLGMMYCPSKRSSSWSSTPMYFTASEMLTFDIVLFCYFVIELFKIAYNYSCISPTKIQ